MKLYHHPISTTSRPIVLFASEQRIPLELQVVNIMTGEQRQGPYASLNPNRLVPLLEDGDFRLTESSAILKYLADKFDSPLYPRDLQLRARVNERMDWINTQIGRDFCFGVVFPQVLPDHRRRSEEAQAATLEWGQARSRRWLTVLDEHVLGPSQRYLCGDAITIADYFGAGFLTLGEVVGCDFASYPRVSDWLGRMKQLESWSRVNAALDAVAAAHRGESFVTV